MPNKVINMKTLFKNTMYAVSIISIASILSVLPPASAAVDKTAGEASSCPGGIAKHRVGAPGKGVVHYQRNDCGPVEFSAFEQSTADKQKTAANGERGVMTGKPGYNRREIKQ